jgi:hypothetical protein
MEQAELKRSDCCDTEFKEFANSALLIFERLKHIYYTNIPGKNKYGGVFMSEMEAVFSKVVSSGKKKYYMDVRRAKTGNLYLSIKEITLGDTQDKSESRRILVFDSAIKDFGSAFDEVRKNIPAKEKETSVGAKASF